VTISAFAATNSSSKPNGREIATPPKGQLVEGRTTPAIPQFPTAGQPDSAARRRIFSSSSAFPDTPPSITMLIHQMNAETIVMDNCCYPSTCASDAATTVTNELCYPHWLFAAQHPRVVVVMSRSPATRRHFEASGTRRSSWISGTSRLEVECSLHRLAFVSVGRGSR
jgi:hypothetical protein